MRADNLQIVPVTQAAEGYFRSRAAMILGSTDARTSEPSSGQPQGWHGTEATRHGMEEAVV